MEIGKVPNELLNNIIRELNPINKDDVLMGAGIGQDCGVLNYGEWACSISSDPITGSDNHQGYLGIHVACNDIAASGAKPMGVTLTILMPKNSIQSDIQKIMDDAKQAAKEIAVSIIGGHTEITDAVNRPVITVTAIGKLNKKDVMYPHNIQAGDKLVLTKHVGLEGSAILAKDCDQYLLKYLDKNIIQEARLMLDNISVCKEARIAVEHQAVYMHDVTEGGLLGAVWEVAEAAKRGVMIDTETVLVRNETRQICRVLGIHPLRLISSGSMLIVVKSNQVKPLVTSLQNNGIPASVIGEITTQLDKVYIEKGKKKTIDVPESDHLFKGFKKVSEA